MSEDLITSVLLSQGDSVRLLVQNGHRVQRFKAQSIQDDEGSLKACRRTIFHAVRFEVDIVDGSRQVLRVVAEYILLEMGDSITAYMAESGRFNHA